MSAILESALTAAQRAEAAKWDGITTRSKTDTRARLEALAIDAAETLPELIRAKHLQPRTLDQLQAILVAVDGLLARFAEGYPELDMTPVQEAMTDTLLACEEVKA